MPLRDSSFLSSLSSDSKNNSSLRNLPSNLRRLKKNVAYSMWPSHAPWSNVTSPLPANVSVTVLLPSILRVVSSTTSTAVSSLSRSLLHRLRRVSRGCLVSLVFLGPIVPIVPLVPQVVRSQMRKRLYRPLLSRTIASPIASLEMAR